MKEKNKYGQYFTIAPVADFMVKLISHDVECKILEPACGKGVFLSKLDEYGFKNIDAYEIDDTLENPFKYVKHQSFISSPLKDKYDVIIGNPPYIRWKNLEKELKEELTSSLLWNKYFNSLCDYLFIFILKSIEQLNTDGELIFICTDYWLNSTNSATLRQYMMRNGYFSEIYHFKEATLFEGVSASLMIFRYIKNPSKTKNIKFYQYKHTSNILKTNEPLQNENFELSEIPQFKENSRWILAPMDTQKSLFRFEESCKKEKISLFNQPELCRIGDICDIGNGMVSGLDKAFNMNQLEQYTEDESKHFIKVLKAKDIEPYKHSSESRYFFIDEPLSETEFIHSYPNVYKHMSQYKNDLLKRYDYGKDTPYWEFIFPRNLNLFSKKEKRILVPCKERISNKKNFRFSLANKDYMPLQDVTGIFKKNNCRESIEYLTAYLNNKRIFEWLKYNGIIKGFIVEFSEAPIASIPYRPINWDNAQEQEIHNKITDCVKKYTESGDYKHIQAIDNYFDILFS